MQTVVAYYKSGDLAQRVIDKKKKKETFEEVQVIIFISDCSLGESTCFSNAVSLPNENNS